MSDAPPVTGKMSEEAADFAEATWGPDWLANNWEALCQFVALTAPAEPTPETVDAGYEAMLDNMTEDFNNDDEVCGLVVSKRSIPPIYRAMIAAAPAEKAVTL